jgi:glucose-1-phosphate thymidylyltransferase
MDKYTAIIPVAGSGKRLRPHTYTYPKVLLTVGDKPIIGHIIDKLIKSQINDICFVIGYLGDKVKEYVEKNYSDKINASYIFQEEQKGLGHAIWLTRDFVKGHILIILGDTIIETDIKKFINTKNAIIGVNEVSDPQRFGIVSIKNGFVYDMIEKPSNPPTNLAISGVYSFPDSSKLYGALDLLVNNRRTTKGEIQLTDAMRIMVKNGYKIKPIKIDGWYDCGKPETLLETNKYILSRNSKKYDFKNCVIVDPVYISNTAKIENSIIGPYASIGDGVVIKDSIVSESIINEHATIKCSNLIKSLIGPYAMVIGRRHSLNVGENSEIKMSEDA